VVRVRETPPNNRHGVSHAPCGATVVEPRADGVRVTTMIGCDGLPRDFRDPQSG
jgi:hypothetical protein